MEQAVIVARCPNAVAWHATIVDALAIWELMLERLLFLASNDLGIVIHNNTCMKTAHFGISTTRLHITPRRCYAIGMLCYWHCLKTAHGGMDFVCLDMVLSHLQADLKLPVRLASRALSSTLDLQ